MGWWILSTVLPWRPVNYSLAVLVIILKWMVWFPIMVIRHGWQEARHAALTAQPRVSREQAVAADHMPFNSRRLSNWSAGPTADLQGTIVPWSHRPQVKGRQPVLPAALQPRVRYEHTALHEAPRR